MSDIKKTVDSIPEGLENEYLTEEESLDIKKIIKSLFIYTVLGVVTAMVSILLKVFEVEKKCNSDIWSYQHSDLCFYNYTNNYAL